MALLAQDFTFLVSLIREQSGIVLDAGKEYLIESRLMPVAKAIGLQSLGDLTNALRKAPKGELAEKVVDAMTTNETTFFRDFFPFETLRLHILPDLIKKRGPSRELNFWCGAASSGQESYSIAMMILEHFPSIALDWKFQYYSTDISKEMLDRCRKGAYTQVEVNRGLPAALLAKYFAPAEGNWYISDKVKKLVQFRPLNLLDPLPPMPAMDIVFMRNVLIYFDVEVKKQILAKVRKILKPDGFLFLGGAETTVNIDPNFVRMPFDKAGCYRIAPPK
jgi:chemotaxis protein methyltransferase CheR